MIRERLVNQGGAALLLAAVVAGVGFVGHSSAAPGRAALAAPMKKVLIKESKDRYHYTPTKITAAKGTTVTWTNKTDVEHNVTVTQGVKVNKDIKNGKTVRFTFTKAGTYKYHCEYHPYMKGTVVVK